MARGLGGFWTRVPRRCHRNVQPFQLGFSTLPGSTRRSGACFSCIQLCTMDLFFSRPRISSCCVSVIPAARRFFQLLQVFSRTVSDSTVKAATSQGKVAVNLPATARQITKTHNRLSKPSKIRCIKIQQVIPIGPQNEQKHRLTGTTTTAKQIKLRLPVPRRCWPSVLLVPRRRWLSGVCSRVRPPAPRVLGLYYYYLARHRSLLCGSHRRRRRSRQR